MNPADDLRAGLQELTGKKPDSGLVETLLAYLDMLAHWNRAYNLTAVKDPADMVSRHLLDSLSVMPFVEPGRLLDAGTGAGLPGIPLAIANGDLTVTLLDSAGKKIRFLNHVRRELGLDNVIVLQDRLETCSPEDGYEGIISRAFGKLGSFVTAARHLATVRTRLMAMKGRFPKGELEALPDWVNVDSIEKLAVPGLQEDRHLVIMSVNP